MGEAGDKGFSLFSGSMIEDGDRGGLDFSGEVAQPERKSKGRKNGNISLKKRFFTRGFAPRRWPGSFQTGSK
jgi:hypothetical protein